MTKEAFCQLINALKDSKTHDDELCDELDNLFRKHRPEQDMGLRGCHFWQIINDSRLEDAVVKVLEAEFEDEEDSWISYYIYELEFGTKPYSSQCGSEVDGTPICLTTPEELYDFVIKNMKEKRAKEIFGDAVENKPNDAEAKKPYFHEFKANGHHDMKLKVRCFDYDGPDDKIPLQMFTGFYFTEYEDHLKGRSAGSDLTVYPGDTVVEWRGAFYAIPKDMLESM